MGKIVVLIGLIIVLGCSDNSLQKNTDTQQVKDSVHHVLNNWHKAAAQANFDNYFEKMDTNAVFIGTDAKENWDIKAFKNFSKPYFKRGKAWSFTPLERNIYLNDGKNIAWFDELLDTWMGTCRGSGILEYKNNTWKIKHYVLSVPVPNEDINAVIAIKRKNDSLFLNKFKK